MATITAPSLTERQQRRVFRQQLMAAGHSPDEASFEPGAEHLPVTIHETEFTPLRVMITRDGQIIELN